MTKRPITIWRVAAIGGCLLSLFCACGPLGPAPVLAEPKLSQATPQDGAVVDQLPASLKLCFTEAAQTEGQNAWQFKVTPPGGQPLGLRVVFPPDGGCVDVFPGAPSPPPQGIWHFDWLVHAQSDGSEASGTIRFQVGALQRGETPLPESAAATSGDDPPVLLLALIGIGALIAVVGIAGFTVRRRRA